MSDEWADEVRAEPRKGGIPKWLWWTCGTGCFLVVLVAAIVAIGGYVLVQNAKDPEKVIPQIQKYLPCDTWPDGYEPSGVVFMGFGYFTVRYPGGRFELQPVGSRQALEVNMSTSQSANFAERDRSAGQLEIQGRTARTLEFKPFGAPIKQMRIDISGQRGPCSYLILSVDENDEFDLEEVGQFLEPFDVWRDED